MSNVTPGKIVAFLGNRPHLYIAPIQREVVWTQKKCRSFLEEILEKPVFLGSIYSQVITDEDKEEALCIYDGLQRISTLLLLWKVIFTEGGAECEKFNYDHHPVVLEFANPELQKDWDDVQKNEFKRNSQVRENYEVFKTMFSKYSENDKRSVREHFKNSCWYDLCIPETENPNNFYIAINSKGTLMSVKDVVRSFYPEENFQAYNRIIATFPNERIQNAFFKDVYFYIRCEKADVSKIIELFEKSSEKPSLLQLKRFANAYLEMLGKAKNIFGGFLPLFAKKYLLQIELSDLSDREKEKESQKMIEFLTITQFLPNGGRTNQIFESACKSKQGKLALGCDVKNTFKIFLQGVASSINDPMILIRNSLREFKYGTVRNNHILVDLLKMADNHKYGKVYSRDKGVKWTIEHIKAQSSNEDWVNNLGNLCLLNGPNNSRAGGEKRKSTSIDDKLYTNSGCRLTEYAFTEMKNNNFSEETAKRLQEEYIDSILGYLKDLSGYQG